jgi:late competence protein required for DNA uptake (superfamily II DNA/RNA helicase)
MYDYEKIIFDTLEHNKHIWIKKATGLGISEFMLRYIAWICLKDDALSGCQICIVTGPRIELAINLVDRIKKLFANSEIAFDTKETVIELGNVKIEAFPSHHLDAMRGLANVSLILLDESDFFPPGQQQDASQLRGTLENQIHIYCNGIYSKCTRSFV